MRPDVEGVTVFVALLAGIGLIYAIVEYPVVGIFLGVIVLVAMAVGAILVVGNDR